jgi:excisionase family DNA binding protein
MPSQFATADALLTYAEAAAHLGIKTGTLHSLVHARRVPHLRFGKRFVRFRKVDLNAWIEQHAIAAIESPAADSASEQAAAPPAASKKGA